MASGPEDLYHGVIWPRGPNAATIFIYDIQVFLLLLFIEISFHMGRRLVLKNPQGWTEGSEKKTTTTTTTTSN
jgi:hypothetical protein